MPRPGYPQMCPYLYYRDADAAVDWLTQHFGFKERYAFRTPEGRIVHAQLELGSGVVFVGPGMVPFGTSGVSDPDAVHMAIYLYVDDVKEHLERARAAGAQIKAELSMKPNGDLTYAASDPQGQRWVVAQPVS